MNKVSKMDLVPQCNIFPCQEDCFCPGAHTCFFLLCQLCEVRQIRYALLSRAAGMKAFSSLCLPLFSIKERVFISTYHMHCTRPRPRGSGVTLVMNQAVHLAPCISNQSTNPLNLAPKPLSKEPTSFHLHHHYPR